MSAASPSDELPTVGIVDVSRFLQRAEGFEEDCKRVSELLSEFGVIVIKDTRVKKAKSDKFLDMLEDYYALPMSEKQKDIHPEYSYQIGATPDNTEKSREDNCKFAASLDAKNKPQTICPPGFDPKWRYFWRVGSLPEKTDFPQLNAPQESPAKFPEWAEVMDDWGTLMMTGCETVARMAAIGFGLPETAFTDLMNQGPHLLAPTGSDIGSLPVGTVLAGLHYDLNFLTIHGRSRYPGLTAWMRGGHKFKVKIEEGCLLLQAGKQLEWLTGGVVFAGFHEVVVTEKSKERAALAAKENRPQWRVSSTLFSHIASDQILKPLSIGASWASKAGDLAKYPPIKAGAQVAEELAAIKLSAKLIEAAAGAQSKP